MPRLFIGMCLLLQVSMTFSAEDTLPSAATGERLGELVFVSFQQNQFDLFSPLFLSEEDLRKHMDGDRLEQHLDHVQKLRAGLEEAFKKNVHSDYPIIWEKTELISVVPR